VFLEQHVLRWKPRPPPAHLARHSSNHSTDRKQEIQTWYGPVKYRTRHLVENYFCDLKQFRSVATRYCKLATSYRAFVHLASWIIDTRVTRRTAKEPVYKRSPRIPEYNTQLSLALVA
jgi:transposase